MSLYDELRSGIRARERQAIEQNGKVLIFGPGTALGKRKRVNLARRLKRRGFEAHTSEKLSRRVTSYLTAYQAEDEHWRHFDLIIVLAFSFGANQELASYAYHPEFRRRVFAVYPEKYDPLYSSSFGSEILREYPYKERVSDEEWDQCRVLDICLDHALAKRQVETSQFRRQHVESG
jgi:hypothetical protein